MIGRVLVNMVGREPKCLRCLQRGHKKFECTAPYCAKCRKVGHVTTDACRMSYAALVSVSVAEAEEEMDDVVYDDVAEEGGNDQQTASETTSWADQMDQFDRAGASSQPEDAAGNSQMDATATVATSAEEPTADTTASSETADRPVAVTTAVEAGSDKSTTTNADDDFTVVKSQGENRKRTATNSLSERNGKILAASASASTSKAASPRNEPTAGRRRTLPAPVVSGRHRHQ